MKENSWLWCLTNTFLAFLVGIYVLLAKDLGRVACNRCDELEKELELQKERCDYLSSIVSRKDSIVININYEKSRLIKDK